MDKKIILTSIAILVLVTSFSAYGAPYTVKSLKKLSDIRYKDVKNLIKINRGYSDGLHETIVKVKNAAHAHVIKIDTRLNDRITNDIIDMRTKFKLATDLIEEQSKKILEQQVKIETNEKSLRDLRREMQNLNNTCNKNN